MDLTTAVVPLHHLECGIRASTRVPVREGKGQCRERKRVISKAMRYFNHKDKILPADREYIGDDWFCFLKEKNIAFVIRLRIR